MLTKRSRKSYGIGKPLLSMNPQPIISKRDPGPKDRSEVGALWIKNSGKHRAVYINEGVEENKTVWGVLSYDYIKASIASPTVTATMNVYKGSLTLTGFTTASAAEFDLTIVNELVKDGDPIQLTVASNCVADAYMVPSKIDVNDNGIIVTIYNDGSAALNGDIVVTFELI